VCAVWDLIGGERTSSTLEPFVRLVAIHRARAAGSLHLDVTRVTIGALRASSQARLSTLGSNFAIDARENALDSLGTHDTAAANSRFR
jgi:hypothetical protein